MRFFWLDAHEDFCVAPTKGYQPPLKKRKEEEEQIDENVTDPHQLLGQGGYFDRTATGDRYQLLRGHRQGRVPGLGLPDQQLPHLDIPFARVLLFSGDL